MPLLFPPNTRLQCSLCVKHNSVPNCHRLRIGRGGASRDFYSADFFTVWLWRRRIPSPWLRKSIQREGLLYQTCSRLLLLLFLIYCICICMWYICIWYIVFVEEDTNYPALDWGNPFNSRVFCIKLVAASSSSSSTWYIVFFSCSCSCTDNAPIRQELHFTKS